MRVVKNISVGRKLYAAAAGMVLMLALVSATALWALSSLSGSTGRLARAATYAQAVDSMQGMTFYIHESQDRYVLNHGDSYADHLTDVGRFDRSLATVVALTSTARERAALALVRARYATITQLDRRTHALVLARRYDEAAVLINGVVNDSSDALWSATTAFLKVADGEQTQARQQFAATKSQATLIMILLGALAAVGGLALAYLLSRVLTRPLVAVQRAAERAADGDLTVAVEVDSNDEIGRMAAAFGTMLQQLRETIGTVASTSDRLAAASQHLASTSEETGRAVGEIASAVGEVAQGAERQVRSVEEARGATDEMALAAQTGAASAQETAAAAAQARAVSEQGAAAVAAADAAMLAVRDSSAAATEVIRALGAKSEQVGGIVATITGIADQTNLLALNAAIEAARAGEQGRGFAVVAEEVRKLAEESQQAAIRISSLIEEIQGETLKAVEAVEDGARKTEEGVVTVDQARRAFLEIGTSVEQMNALVEQIVVAIDSIAGSSERMQSEIADVSSVAEQSSAATEQVSASAEQTSASTQEIAASAQDLARTAEQLHGIVGRFTLELA